MSTELVRTGSVMPEALTGADRCDRCGAQAYAAAMFHGRPLTRLNFCAHHFTRWEARIRDVAVAVLDLRYRLRAAVDAQKQLRD